MLQFFHKYNKSIIGLLFAVIICGSMLFFGVNFGGNQTNDYAVRVDDSDVPIDRFYARKREVQQQYQRAFGQNYYKIATQLEQGLSRRVVDGLIEEVLLAREAHKLGIYVGNDQIRSTVYNDLFPDGFDEQKYRLLLDQLGLSAPAFEKQLASELLRSSIAGVIRDTATPSSEEIVAYIRKNESTYNVSYLKVSPENFTSQIKKLSDRELEEYYLENGSDYETPARVKYSFVVLKPENYRSMVEVNPEDIEFYYSEHQRDYRLPEKAKVRQIELKAATQSKTEERDKIKALANELLTRIKNGQNFSDLAAQYSEDPETKSKGGELGWIGKGDEPLAYERAVFKLKGKGIADLIQTGNSFYIVEVEDYQA